MRYFREIRKVGLIDWLWFVVRLKRDEFHWSLNIMWNYDGKMGSSDLISRRQRAHRIDDLLSTVK